MPRQPGTKVQNTFVKGVITQATGLNFPEDACTDALNCHFDEYGTVRRRLGIKFEAEDEPNSYNAANNAFSTYTWEDVAEDADLTIQVVQIGDRLFFYDTTSYANVSLGEADNFINLGAFKSDPALDPSNRECQYANGHGVLFVYHPRCEPFYVEYDINTEEVTATQITIEIRDFAGEAEDIEVNERPAFSLAAMSEQHHYNLLNQGWTEDRLEEWDTARTDMPSNADQMWYFKNIDDEWDLTVVDDRTTGIGNSPAPKGHFIYNVFDQDRSGKTGIPNLTNITTGIRRFSTGAFFAGRVWYTGLDKQEFKGHLYFSQVIEDFEQFGKCHQVNDPTSETLFDLLPTDGGKIDIAEAGTIHKLVPIGSGLFVFTNKGIWEITGSQGLGFAANDYVVRKVAEIPSLSASSFVNVAGTPMWWNRDGIYTLTRNQQGAYAVQSLTDDTIRGLFNEINNQGKKFARGAYNRVDKTVQWVYNPEFADTVGGRFTFTRSFVFNLKSNSFSPWSMPTNSSLPAIKGIFSVPEMGSDVNIQPVFDGFGNPVVDGDGNPVVIQTKGGTVTERYIYIVAKVNDNVTFALERDSGFVDWDTEDYSSYFISGYSVHGEGNRKFQTNYINIYVDSTNSGEFYVSSVWDYSTSGTTGRWSTPQILTYLNPDYDFIDKRVKLRGHGKAVQVKVESSTAKDFKIIGWSLFESANKWV